MKTNRTLILFLYESTENIPISKAVANIIIELRVVYKGYYVYKKTLDEYFKAKENTLAEPVVIFSNIENGYGIFAGYSSQKTILYPSNPEHY